MAYHRKIWQKHYGEIPKDEKGRTYDIHHIDGNPLNNDISNLVALSRREHYETHKRQGDWAACLILAESTNFTAEQLSDIAKRTAEKTSRRLKGVPLSAEHRRKLSEAKRGKPSNRRGTVHSEESRKRMSASRLGKRRGPQTEEHRNKIRAALKGRVFKNPE
jgi:hypothetical protein